jgi:hypothetical protein
MIDDISKFDFHMSENIFSGIYFFLLKSYINQNIDEKKKLFQ